MKRRDTARPSKLLQGLMGIRKPTREEKYRAALAGDSMAVEWLHFDKPELDDKLQLVIDMCRDGGHKPLVQRLLLECLVDNAPRIRPGAEGSREMLAGMFTYAAFAHHRDIPENITLYRGTGGVSIETARAGYFWTPTVRYAARYAQSTADEKGAEPLLIRAEVCKHDVAVFFHPFAVGCPVAVDPDKEAGEWEALLLTPPEHVEVQEISNLEELRLDETLKSGWFAKHVIANHEENVRRAVKKIQKRMREVGYEV